MFRIDRKALSFSDVVAVGKLGGRQPNSLSLWSFFVPFLLGRPRDSPYLWVKAADVDDDGDEGGQEKERRRRMTG